MQCTSCKAGKLLPAYLEPLFPCHTCNQCGGSFVMLDAYLKWLEREQVSAASSSIEVAAEETSNALICPKTSTLMLKYRISNNNSHRLDLSPSINAIWMDKGEWELLKSEGLASKLNHVFTDTWQRKIREAKAEETLKALYEKEFGENYSAVKDFRRTLQKMPNKGEVIAYLISDDPYKA